MDRDQPISISGHINCPNRFVQRPLVRYFGISQKEQGRIKAL
jgi:hypothetical protein